MSVYEFNNPHPKGLLIGDCVVRAFSLAFDKDYIEMRRELNSYKRAWNFDSYKSDDFIKHYLNNYRKMTFQATKGRPRVKAEEFVLLFGKRTFIVKMAKHIACIKDGKLLDTWDSSYRSIYTAWTIK